MALVAKLTWATVDLTNPSEVETLRAQQHAVAIRRAHQVVADMQARGILDSNGRRIRKDLPPDMQEDSGCDMSAL